MILVCVDTNDSPLNGHLYPEPIRGALWLRLDLVSSYEFPRARRNTAQHSRQTNRTLRYGCAACCEDVAPPFRNFCSQSWATPRTWIFATLFGRYPEAKVHRRVDSAAKYAHWTIHNQWRALPSRHEQDYCEYNSPFA